MNLIGAGWRFAEPASIQIMEGVRSNDRPDVIGPPCEFRPAFPGIRCRNFNGTDDNAVAPNRGEPMYGKGTLEESGGLSGVFWGTGWGCPIEYRIPGRRGCGGTDVPRDFGNMSCVSRSNVIPPLVRLVKTCESIVSGSLVALGLLIPVEGQRCNHHTTAREDSNHKESVRPRFSQRIPHFCHDVTEQPEARGKNDPVMKGKVHLGSRPAH